MVGLPSLDATECDLHLFYLHKEFVQRMVCSGLQPQGAGRSQGQGGTRGTAGHKSALWLQKGRSRQQKAGGG